MIPVPVLTTSLIHFSLKGWENVLFELGTERVKHIPLGDTTRAPNFSFTNVPMLREQLKFHALNTVHTWEGDKSVTQSRAVLFIFLRSHVTTNAAQWKWRQIHIFPDQRKWRQIRISAVSAQTFHCLIHFSSKFELDRDMGSFSLTNVTVAFDIPDLVYLKDNHIHQRSPPRISTPPRKGAGKAGRRHTALHSEGTDDMGSTTFSRFHLFASWSTSAIEFQYFPVYFLCRRKDWATLDILLGCDVEDDDDGRPQRGTVWARYGNLTTTINVNGGRLMAKKLSLWRQCRRRKPNWSGRDLARLRATYLLSPGLGLGFG